MGDSKIVNFQIELILYVLWTQNQSSIHLQTGLLN